MSTLEKRGEHSLVEPEQVTEPIGSLEIEETSFAVDCVSRTLSPETEVVASIEVDADMSKGEVVAAVFDEIVHGEQVDGAVDINYVGGSEYHDQCVRIETATAQNVETSDLQHLKQGVAAHGHVVKAYEQGTFNGDDHLFVSMYPAEGAPAETFEQGSPVDMPVLEEVAPQTLVELSPGTDVPSWVVVKVALEWFKRGADAIGIHDPTEHTTTIVGRQPGSRVPLGILR